MYIYKGSHKLTENLSGPQSVGLETDIPELMAACPSQNVGKDHIPRHLKSAASTFELCCRDALNFLFTFGIVKAY